jgi:5-methylcytosine-specific restriction endonuclease McrA
MPWKDKEKQREAIRKHYYANREVYIKKALMRKQTIRKWLNEVKESQPCTDCGVDYPYYVMDFDHIRDKTIEINKLINSCSMTKLKAEIAKCEIVCSNCHRQRTFDRQPKAQDMPG